MLTLWHVSVSCLVLVVVVCACPLLASRPVVSECRSVGVSRCRVSECRFCLDTYLTPLTLYEEVHCRDGLTLA